MDADWMLILKMRQGSEAAWDQFIRRYYGDILKYCYFHCRDRHMAEDLTQEAFLKFFAALEGYQHRGKAKNYLYTIAANLCKDQCAGPQHLPLETAWDIGSDQSEELEQHLMLTAAIGRLPENLRDVLVLHYYQGLKLSEVAAVLKIGLPLVKYRLRQAKERIRKESVYGSE